MKKHILPLLAALAVLVTVACTPPSTMVEKTPPASVSALQPNPGKAVLVVSRTTSFGFAIPFATYLEKTYIGSTRGKSYFAKFDVDPGTKYVSSFGENGLAVKIDFEPGKVYCLQHNVSMGWLKARVSVEAVDPKRLDSGDLAGCRFMEMDPAKKDVADLTEAEYRDVIQNAETLVVKVDGTEELIPAKAK
jgi:hypothetical protein